MIKVGVSIVSHNNQDEIIQNHANYNSIENVEFEVCITDNTGNNTLKKFCEEKQYRYILNKTTKGFGENNNQNFKWLRESEINLLLIINPDAKIDVPNYVKFLNKIWKDKWDIFGAKVIEPINIYSSQRRKFPKIYHPLLSLLTKKKYFMLDPKISSIVDWVGGSFLNVRFESYKKLKGFDERFFMYYEDVDLCRRAKNEGMTVMYYSDFSFEHSAKRAGHKIFSKYFFLNIQSMIRYFFYHSKI